MCSGAQGGQKRASDPPELELQAAVSTSYGCWELSAEKAADAFIPEPSFQPLEFFAFLVLVLDGLYL